MSLFFCDLCIIEIELGNRPTAHFNKEGRNNLIVFEGRTGKKYDRIDTHNFIRRHSSRVDPDFRECERIDVITSIEFIHKHGLDLVSVQNNGRPLPKFGEWDVNDPTSAESFTVIFNKARDEKKTGSSNNGQGSNSPSKVFSSHKQETPDASSKPVSVSSP
ncbi:RPM1-interacting protein 4 [Platanthera zijinensis]|uniref:RPM1-interacting protein 4 n=1 Tax=Platanthera zijinensis TaxID=2320716 RepID=A0AAP0BIR9_9ASPA